MPAEHEDVAAGFVAVGRVLGPRGLLGDAKVEPLGPRDVLAGGRLIFARGQQYRIERSRTRAAFLYLKLSGIDSREAANELRAAYLEVREADLAPLAEGQYYRFQLMGLAVRATDGRDLGRITDVLSSPDSDVFVVQGPLGEVLVPSVDEIVREVDLETGVVTVEIVPGLLP